MILLKYSKLNGAQFIPHLDTLKHLGKIIRRTGISVEYSQGFNPHMLIYMSSPIPLGLKTKAEYALIATNETPTDFATLFNKSSLRGLLCEEVYFTDKKLNIANDITSAIYHINGINKFNVNEILDSNEFFVPDKKLGEKQVRDKIISLKFENNVLIAHLKCGNETLRIDNFTSRLLSLYGGNHVDVVKNDVRFLNNISVFEYVKEKNNV